MGVRRRVSPETVRGWASWWSFVHTSKEAFNLNPAVTFKDAAGNPWVLGEKMGRGQLCKLPGLQEEALPVETQGSLQVAFQGSRDARQNFCEFPISASHISSQ